MKLLKLLFLSAILLSACNNDSTDTPETGEPKQIIVEMASNDFTDVSGTYTLENNKEYCTREDGKYKILLVKSTYTYSNLSKREILQISRQRAKLDKTLGSIADLTRLPSALFVIDVMKENIAVREANRLGIPVFGIVDTNSDPTNIDFVIPANDDATKSVEVILDACCAAMIEGLEERKAEKIDMEAAGEAPANKGKKKSAKARLDKSDEEAINAAKAAAFLKEDEEA